jgi:hypothetical protein
MFVYARPFRLYPLFEKRITLWILSAAAFFIPIDKIDHKATWALVYSAIYVVASEIREDYVGIARVAGEQAISLVCI